MISAFHHCPKTVICRYAAEHPKIVARLEQLMTQEDLPAEDLVRKQIDK